MKLSIKLFAGFALVALLAVLAIGTFAPVEVVDSDQEVATAIEVADFSTDAPVVSIEQSIAPDALTDLSITATTFATADSTLDHSVTTNFVQAEDPVFRLAVTNLDSSPELSAHGDGGIL